jgi:hypothetical protein
MLLPSLLSIRAFLSAEMDQSLARSLSSPLYPFIPLLVYIIARVDAIPILRSRFLPDSIGPDVGSYQYYGCYIDVMQYTRTLVAKSMTSASLTVESCMAFYSPYPFFGTENGNEVSAVMVNIKIWS